MRIFFDVDDTLITWDVRLRPHVHDVFQQLRDDGHDIYLWSGYGPRWEVVRRHGLDAWVEDCFIKPLYHHGRMLEPLGIAMEPHFVVDDHPHLVDIFGGCVVETYLRADPADREMWRVQDAVARAVASAASPRRA